MATEYKKLRDVHCQSKRVLNYHVEFVLFPQLGFEPLTRWDRCQKTDSCYLGWVTRRVYLSALYRMLPFRGRQRSRTSYLYKCSVRLSTIHPPKEQRKNKQRELISFRGSPNNTTRPDNRSSPHKLASWDLDQYRPWRHARPPPSHRK